MSRKLICAISLAVAVAIPLANVSIVHAQDEEADKKAALAAYKKGTIQYNLGNWTRAIEFFKKAFETYPDAAFLFNIAQSYRQAEDCKQSGFFYKRYLAIKPKAPNRDEVQGFIKELADECAAKAATDTSGTDTTGTDTTGTDTTGTDTTGTDTTGTDTTGTDTTGTDTTGTDTSGTDTTGTDTSGTDTTGTTGTDGTTGTQVADATTGTGTGTDITGGTVIPEDPEGPKLVMAYGSLGPAIFSLGDLETSPQFNLTVGGGYPLKFGEITVDAGALISHSRLSWGSPTADGTVALTSLLINGGGSMEVAPKIRVRGELGIGTMIYSGLDVAGNPFVQDGLMATGALSSLSLRLAAGGEYAVTDAISVSAQPLVLSTSPAPSGMRAGIDSVTSYQALVGVGYRM